MEMGMHPAVPEDFPYAEVLRKGVPVHEKTDPFRIRHPRMDVGHRAKIFAPFDALKGFNEALAVSRRLQEERMMPGRDTPANSEMTEAGESDVYAVLY